MVGWPPEKRQELETRLPKMVESQKMQQWKIAQELGVSRDWVGRTCKKLGLETQRTGPRGGAEHPNWKGGAKIHGGYRYIWFPDHPNATKQGYVLEHRLIMETHLKRLLDRKEVVHHKNGHSLDNRLENLVLFQTNADHLRHELTGHTPNWTREGWLKILAGCRKGRSSLVERAANGSRRPRTKNRRT